MARVHNASAADNAVAAFVVNAGRIRRPWPTSRTCGAAGQDFPDALSAGAAAGSYNAFGAIFGVVVPTNNDLMPSATESYLDTFLDHIGHLTAFLSAIGGQAEMALMDAGWSDFDLEGGSNRYDTAMNVAHEFFGGNRTVGVTAGLNWPDALAGGALFGTLDGPLLLTSGSTTLDSNTATIASDQSGFIATAFIFGGTLPSSINGQIGAAISGPAGFDASLPRPRPRARCRSRRLARDPT